MLKTITKLQDDSRIVSYGYFLDDKCFVFHNSVSYAILYKISKIELWEWNGKQIK